MFCSLSLYLLWDLTTVKRDTHYQPRNTWVFSYCPVPQHCIPPLSQTLCFSSCPFKPPPSWTLSLLRLVCSLMHEPALLTRTEQLCRRNCKVPNYLLGIKYVNTWHSDVVWCHNVMELKVGLPIRHFKSSVFCGRGTSVWGNFAFFHFLDFFYMHNDLYKTLKDRGKKN